VKRYLGADDEKRMRSIKEVEKRLNEILKQITSTEIRPESLYKEKSQSIPNKKSDRFSVKKSDPKKVKPQRPRTRVF
jgi:DNA-binding protein H-NS